MSRGCCQSRGLFYPPDPGEKTASIGGNVITNAGGMKAVRYGLTRDFVRCIQAVLPDGCIVNFSSNVVKNTTGYDLKDLVIGSEGTLCILTQVTLKLLPAPSNLHPGDAVCQPGGMRGHGAEGTGTALCSDSH